MKIDSYHYTESGLLNVFIEGIQVEIDDEGDEVITINNVNDLHKVIALGIVSHDKGIAGDELRFLRTEIGMTQAELGAFVHRSPLAIGRWERGEIAIDAVSETSIRRLAIEKLGLSSDTGIDELSKKSVPTAEIQPINIVANDRGYELLAKIA